MQTRRLLLLMIVMEALHEHRIIPLDGRPHVGPNIRQWLGDSRGRWEGQTLVVETTNFNDRMPFRGATAGCASSNGSRGWTPRRSSTS
jgi:hypothetical protein